MKKSKTVPAGAPSRLGRAACAPKKRKKPMLKAYMPTHNERTRLRVFAGYTIVDVGPRAIVISKIRHATDEDRSLLGHENVESVLDWITIRFDDQDKISVKTSIVTFNRGSSPTHA